MSEPFWNKISDLIGAVVKPNQLMLLVTIVSGAALFDILNFQEILNIQDEINRYRFWIVLAFVFCGGLQIIAVVSSSLKWVVLQVKRVAGNILAARVTLSYNASMVLVLLAARQPDGTRLVTEHPAVRELRLHQLIKISSYVVSGGGIHEYELTERGMAAALPRLRGMDEQADPRIKELFSDVTGN